MLASMCGRFTQARSWSELVQLYELAGSPSPSNFAPRYNIAPTQNIAVVRPAARDSGGREMAMMRWGLVPLWAKDVSIGAKMINARAESVRTKPAFRQAFRHRRCLIVADGFYEWRKEEGKTRKQPYYITRQGDAPFAFAGLWEEWQPQGEQKLETCTIITTQASEAVAWIHERMPVMLEPTQFDAWIAPDVPLDTAEAMLAPYPGALATHPVGTRVNSVRNDDPQCIAPVPAASERLL
jgi:putative SOS response-associated peptidase YedK